ncbi:tetratricopeptide repeat protein [Morganella sp. GD04133]|uniref:tetratricopeptide repeat protein n=1 Tax=Morganella sp. GD04133 TaxID=2975435 RepID=UPI00244B3ED6|nr:tetratricopeptide repeat protein [Morganella sp. GD04133]MDH0354891.1 sel1 repeat family protein [Morganella sp. GD04133]
MKTVTTAGLLLAVLFTAAPLQAKQAAVQHTEARALRGNIAAQITLADNFRTQQDIVQAKYWYRKAAEQNNPYAQNELGKLLLLNDQSVKSLQDAKIWFEKAAVQKYAPGQVNLANVYLHLADLNHRDNKEMVQAHYWFEQAARQNMAVARYQLGMMYLYGEGADQDISKARTWFEKAAAQDQPDALYQLGVMYYRGKGCERSDCAIARNFYERAARQSHGPAQFYLAMMSLQGHGTQQDYSEGVALMKAACDNGEPEACPWVKNLTENEDTFRQIFSGKP